MRKALTVFSAMLIYTSTAYAELGSSLINPPGIDNSNTLITGIDVGDKRSLNFNTNYCLGFPALIYAEIYGNKSDQMGVQINVNGSLEARAKADSEGWRGYESVNTIVAESDCFSISHVYNSTSSRRAWYRKL
jgi:hypothetical protein